MGQWGSCEATCWCIFWLFQASKSKYHNFLVPHFRPICLGMIPLLALKIMHLLEFFCFCTGEYFSEPNSVTLWGNLRWPWVPIPVLMVVVCVCLGWGVGAFRGALPKATALLLNQVTYIF